MTCREFMDAAELLTPSQLLRLQPAEQPLSRMRANARSCREWLESHRALGNAFHALSASKRRSSRAGPQVEQAVLQAFRNQDFAPPVVVMPQRATSSLWTLSRVFEYGAYAAVAAALIVGVFLGVRVLRDTQSQGELRRRRNGHRAAEQRRSEFDAESKSRATEHRRTKQPRRLQDVRSEIAGGRGEAFGSGSGRERRRHAARVLSTYR